MTTIKKKSTVATKSSTNKSTTTKKTVAKKATKSAPKKVVEEKLHKENKKSEVKSTSKKVETKSAKNAAKPVATPKVATKTSSAPIAKRRVVTSYNHLSPELLEKLNEKYPLGWSNYVTKVDKGNGDSFYAVMLDTEEVSYLVKVPVKVDTEITDEVEKDIYGGEVVSDDDFVGTTDDDETDEYDDKDEGGI